MIDFRFDWTPQFELNIPSIDSQHMEFFKIGRDVEQLVQNKCIGVSDQQLLQIVLGLREYSSYHFYEEERIMGEYRYPKLKEHKERHNEISSKISKLDIPYLKANPLKGLKEIQEMLLDIAFFHILNDDKEMAVYISDSQKEIAAAKSKHMAEDDEYSAQYGPKICELDVSNAYLYFDQDNVGRCILIYRGSRSSFDELKEVERSAFLEDVSKISRAIEKAYKPECFNYGMYCDLEKRLHYHIVPKYESGSYWKQVFPVEQGTKMEEAINIEDLKIIADKIRKNLKREM